MRGVRILESLLAGDATHLQLVERTGASRSAVDEALKALRTRGTPLVRVSGWLRRPGAAQGRDVAIYALADGKPDAPRLLAKTRNQREEAYKASNPEHWRRLHRAANARMKQRDPEYFAQAMREHRSRKSAASQQRRAAFELLIAINLGR